MDIKEYISSGIIELYVMGLCSPEEEKELEQLRRQHPELQEAILRYETEMENKMLRDGTLPPVDVDEKILHTIDSLQAPVIDISGRHSSVRKINPVATGWWKPAVAASIALLIISAFFNYSLYRKNKKLNALVQNTGAPTLPLSDYNVFTDPTITPVAMYGVGSHSICRCTMFWDKKTGKMYIMIHHLPKSSAAKDYQLWAEVDGKPVSIGIINDEIRGRFIEVSNVPYRSVAFTVTLEKAGGTDAPTVAETYLAGKI
jgi:anti-sigma-K factor RskA